MKEATDIQMTYLADIKVLIARNGYSPSVRELAELHGVTSKCAFDNLWALKEKGYVTWEPKRPRTLRILERIRA